MLDEALKYFLKRQKESWNKRLDLNQCIEIRKECCPFRCESSKVWRKFIEDCKEHLNNDFNE